ncbi:hypothetical protein GLW04_12365 [Halobacillus litoralis]|uniref:Uncharacterized protein n=1 Tax=Halobacillus litoralis TaxID=45668 RepID=A0A845DT76_9BACI|nr:hypothetical protein [Halobacillus litoralis]MYL20690.1 hypothetical protein [Halobacillus litoralis]
MTLAKEKGKEQALMTAACLSEYEKDCLPSNKGERGDGESFSILKNS